MLLIEAADPAVGPVALIPIGMADVSSCVFAADRLPGAHLTQGQEVGHFTFGGSAEALPRPHDPDAPPVRVRSRIATTR